MDGKRVPSQQGGPAPKRGPSSEFDDLMEEDLAADDGPAYLPDDLDVEDPELGEAGRNWTRPPVAPFNPEKDSLVFQQLEVDYCLQRPRRDIWPTPANQVPVVRMYGVNDAGNSVCVFVHGFEPYFYCDCPHDWSPEDCNELLLALKGGQQRPYLKIVCALPNLVAPARGALEDGVRLASGQNLPGLASYESNVLYALRFMVDTNMGGGQWLEIPPGCWKAAAGAEGSAGRATWCQIEAHCVWDKIIAHPAEGDWLRVAPLRILSIDIECCGRKGHFPEPQQDPIASMVTVLGETKPRVKNIMTLGHCAPIVGAEAADWGALSAPGAAPGPAPLAVKLLERCVTFERGYNINNFDLPYLFERAKSLKYKDLTIEGRVQFDVYMALQRDHKLSSYTLNAVSAHFLGEQKEDVHHSAISDLQNGNAETRRRLAVYCLKDAYLPQRLLDKLMYMYNHIEMARVTGVPPSYLLTRGQSIKVFSQLLRKARQKGFILPFMKQGGAGGAAGGGGDAVGYEGATVLEPKIEAVKQLPPEAFEKSPSGDCFVKGSVQRGILPEILEELLAARKRAKADLKKETDPFKRAVLDGRQLALKVSANSVYGFTGATVGKMPCLAISASTTAYGRQMIEATRTWVQEEFCVAKGFKTDCEVIYGDTDSVMVNFKAANLISKKFPPPVKLEFEKVYYPYLLMNKKRYAGLLWTKPDKYDKMDSKGIETVRRDNCELVRKMVATSLDKILIERDEAGAIEYVKGIIRDLLMNKVDMSLLVVTKALAQEAEDYKVKSAHVELAEKMRKRDPATAPAIGDRVPYVIVKAAKGAKAYEKAEDPIYALENNLPIDVQHYLDHQLTQPLMRIFEPVCKDVKAELLSGAHTRSISVATPSTAAGGIMRFAKVKPTCLACRATLTDKEVATATAAGGSSSLCGHCASREGEIYARSLAAVNSLEDQFGQLWSQCQRCQGSLHQDVLCTSRDCPIFYRRKKVAKELNEAHATLARFVDW
eukprot:gene2392-2696_t